MADKNKQFFSEWFQKIRDAIKGFDKYTEAARILDKAEQDVQDALGQLFAEGMAEAVRTHDLVGDMKNTAQEGGEVRQQMRGYTVDGYEVYETNEDLKGLSYTEKLDLFKRSFYEDGTPQYIGKQVRFQMKDGSFRFADINRFTQRENTDKINPGRINQWDKAKINVGASGDFLTLLQGSIYDRERKNEKEGGKDTHKVTDIFEYYLKTVYIDGKPFDVIVNVSRAKSQNRFVYEVRLEKNSGLPQLGPQSQILDRRPKVQSTRLLGNPDSTITQATAKNKPQNNKNSGRQNMERSYEQGSDLELMADAAEALSEAGGEEYWAALLESAPELKEDQSQLRGLMKDYRAQAKRLAETETKLAEARRQLTTTNRKLNTRGIAGLSQSIMKELGAGDAKNRGVAKQVTQILTDAYQKGLDAIDRGEDAPKV